MRVDNGVAEMPPYINLIGENSMRMSEKVQEMLLIDCRKQEGKERINKILWKIKPIKQKMIKLGYEKGDIVPLEQLEKFLQFVRIQYGYRTQWINSYFETDKTKKPHKTKFVFYTHGLLDNNSEWITNLEGRTIWELFAKTAIVFYDEIKKGEQKE